jgi:hypothetical protein
VRHLPTVQRQIGASGALRHGLGCSSGRRKSFTICTAAEKRGQGWNAVHYDARMRFEIVSEISDVETFATGSGIRELARLRRSYGRGRWRKRKGIATVRLSDGSVRAAELHWYEASVIGRKEFKIKRLL